VAKPAEAPPPPRLSKTRHVTLADPIFGNLKLLFPVPQEDPWGVLAPLKETPWGARIPVVSGAILAHAMHGHTKLLRENLGRPPRIAAQRVPEEEAWCLPGLNGNCAMAGANCRPGSGSLPQCYLPPKLTLEQAYLAAAVALAWEEDRYVLIVEGEGFVL